MRVSPAFILLFAFFANYGMATAAEDVQAVKGAQVKSLFYDPCLRSVADVMVATYIWGDELIKSNITPPANVGSGYYTGPRLKYLKDRTELSYGEWCGKPVGVDAFAIAGTISPETVAKARIGNDHTLATPIYPTLNSYFQVYTPSGDITNCILKLNFDLGSSVWDSWREITMSTYMRKESGCENLPNLQIFDTGAWCKRKFESGDCKNGNFGDAYMVYYDNLPKSTAATISEDGIMTTQGAFDKPDDLPPVDENETAPAPAGGEADTTPSAPAAPSSATSFLMEARALIFYGAVASVAAAFGAF